MSASASPAKRTAQSLDPDEGDGVTMVKRVKRERVDERAMVIDEDSERDASDEEMDDNIDDVDANIEELRRQRAVERGRRNPEDLATAGVVKEISLQNFMCHENLTVTLAEKVNFVVGHNGSGKSAILSGLAVALGAKATVTGRGAGLKSMIMTGKDRAKVTVTMRNVGEDAFMPELFGDEIVIERNFDKSGASNFKFRASKDGKILSDKRDMLNKMCSQWQISIDSPLCMLTQDNAKTFLARTDPKVMYSFFLKGTGLASIMEEYQSTKIHREKLSRDLANAEEALPEQQSKVKKLQNLIQFAEKARNLRKKQEDLKAQLAWAFVHDKERDIETVRQFANELQAKIDMLETKLEEIDAAQEKAKSDVTVIREEIAKFVEDNRQTQQEMSAKKKKLQEARTALQAAKASVKECKGEIMSRDEEIAEMEEKLAAAQREQAGEMNPEQVKLLAQLEKADAQKSGLQRQLPQSERAVATAKAELDEATKALSDIQLEATEAERQYSEAKRSLDNLQARRTDRLAPYGRNLRWVMQAIEAAQWKHSKPIGPLGLHVKLKDPVYRNCLSNMLGSSLCSFAVRDPADQNTLQRIFEQCARDNNFSASPARDRGPPNLPAVTWYKGDRFDFSNGDLARQGVGETVLSKLEVDNEDVLRILITSHQIERTLVAPSDNDALDVMDRVLGPHHQSIVVFSASEFRHNGHVRNRLRQSGPQPKWKGPDMFVTDVAAEIERLRPIVAEREATMRTLRAELRVRQTDADKASEKLKTAEKALEHNQRGIPHIRRAIEAITDKLNALRPIDGNATEISLQEVRGEKAKLQEELNNLEGSLDVRQKDFEAAEADSAAAQDSLNSFHEEIAKKKDMLTSLQQQVKKCDNERMHYKGSLQRAEQALQKEQATIDEDEKTLKSWTNSALGFMERPDEFGNAADIEAERKAVDKQIEQAKRRTNIDLDQVVQQHLIETERLNKTILLINSFRDIERLLKTGFEDRTDRWQVLRKNTSIRIHMRFIENIRKRGFDGRLHFDHDVAEELRLEVATSNDAGTQREMVYKGPASLSGGERSFVTVSLLLSMWDSAPASLRCLDEWDVFLDSANRRIAANLLMEAARDATSKQFVLISPLDMNGVNTAGRGNKVIRLADPVRNQRRLEEFQ
ncbi:P-loop containing nucleoside triphosphate hydrolase protein [Cutaneotrichosporon oleaginosum]|uniref:p-loop containing nucleoside triphosphate hydrolase protein n=1 Tax=Cutaneotrichosporon oleaginosum TaxID=879819 RepID=A0A0J0XPR8_9TREE|nr:P-loop containing nucleoside triphosphate hydrolase protein [Cutaneotrichosporon oleaginosum]KLT43062.1 P-loop containing nucleoside triphosphate hydrolase protein [Cutaneotrichosporon oleaginosum]TXT09994.1 hypothetical protein COLE_03928 [Cutaneotrichosporon oleaginosum]